MCGIFGLFTQTDKSFNLQSLVHKNHRGPDNTQIYNSIDNLHFEFNRLCINDLSESGNQPFENENYIWMCNGEIYNYKQLCNKYSIFCKGKSDCEVIGPLLNIIGIDSLSRSLDGVFAISIFDKRDNTLYLIRDPIGVRPLFYYKEDDMFTFASEGKTLNSFVKDKTQIKQFPPSSYMIYDKDTFYINNYIHIDNLQINKQQYFNTVTKQINNSLTESIKKRLISDRPIGCLLSGGLDSSLVASILSRLLKNKKLKTFSVGFKDSEDLKYAKKVAKYLRSDHYELILDYDEAMSRLPELIEHIETYDVTTIRASLGMYLLSEYISKNHPEKVIFSGEGADELFGGYLYFNRAPNNNKFVNETNRLVKQLHYYDVLRSDRCTSAFGLELRVPFLDYKFVQYVLQLPGSLRNFNNTEKYILRMSFIDQYLPNNILFRKKEAFSDGVGSMKKPFYKHIQEYIINQNKFNTYDLSDDEIERKYYKNIYFSHYSYIPIPAYWLPKWFETNNPSARVLID